LTGLVTTSITPGREDHDPDAPLYTDRDVLQRVDYLIDQPSRRQRSVWLAFLSPDGIQLPVVTPIDAAPERPDSRGARNLCHMAAHVLADAAPGGSAVIALTRPGGGTVDDTDRCWFAALHSAARDEVVTIRMLCLATSDGVRQLTVDDAG
jgi:hypothetical protein